MNKILKCILVAACGMSALLTCSADVAPSYIRTPQMTKPPLIDGKIQEGEWRGASESFGTLQLGTNYLTGRDAVFFIGYDTKNLYFACRSELPPEGMKLLSRVRERNGKVYADDAVELIIMPPHKEYVYQFISNSLGTFFAQKYPVVRGSVCVAEQKEWAPQAMTASSFKDGNWEIEGVLPLADIGVKELPFEQEWRLQMTRDWRQPAEQTPWNKSGNFCNPDSMGIMVMDKDVPATHFQGLGKDYSKGLLDIGFSAFNSTGTPCEVECDVSVVSDGPPRPLNTKERIAPGQSKDFALKYSEKAAITSDLSATIKESKTGKLLLRRNLKFGNSKETSWEKPGAQENTEMEFAYYPYYKLIKCRVDAAAAGNAITMVSFYVKDSNGKSIGQTAAGQKIKNDYRAELKLPELAENTYKAVCEIAFKDGKKKTLEKEFVVKHFPWEHNQIGLEKVIVPPFKPLKTNTKKREVSALMTGYGIKGLFWDRIYSQGENILTSPIKLMINGKDSLQEKTFEFTSVEDHAVNAEASVSGSGLKINSKQEYDYDGMCKVTLDIIPDGKVAIDNAWIEIPLKKSVARLMHTMHNTMKNHPADFIQQGNGVVWDSRMGYKSDEVRGNFWPYFWLGDIYKGFCWFTASDKDWSLDYEKAAIQIIRKDDSVILRINIVNKPCVWEKPFQYVMGFQPTPVKPRMAGWRRVSERVKFKNEGSVAMALLAGSSVWSADGAYDPWPAGKDYSMIRKLAKSERQQSAKDTSDVAPFIEKHFPGVSKTRYDFVKRHLLRGRAWSTFADYFVPYLNPTASEMYWDEYKVYMDEWWYSNYRANTSDDYNTEPCRSYQDMLLYYTRELVRNGMDGIYYDNIRDRTSYDTTTGPAYELPDGKIQPYFTIFSVRELLKRTYTMLYLENKTLLDNRPLLITHMTNTNIVPCMSFSTISLDLEAKFGPADFQDRFSEGWLLSTTIGTQTGCAPEVLVQITGNEKEFVTRTFLAVTLAYDLPIVLNCGGLTSTFKKTWDLIRNFGYGDEETKVFACWAAQDYIKVLTPGVKSALYLKKDKAMLVISGFSNKDNIVKINIAGLGNKFHKIFNAETEKEIKVENGIISIHLPKHDFKLLIIENTKP
ncbi:MAG: glycoside hydrolase domain-containing protein [Victivallaceae bacterium]